MKTAHPARLMSPFRRLSWASLLLVAGCGLIHLPPPEGRSLDERRRALDEVPAARQTAAGEGTGSTAVVAADAAPPGDEAASTPRSMNDAKTLDDPDLGIRLPLGIPPLKAGSGNRD